MQPGESDSAGAAGRRAVCPGCGKRRVLYGVGLEVPVCHDCGMVVSFYRAYLHLGIVVSLLKDPEVVARIEAISESAAVLVRTAQGIV